MEAILDIIGGGGVGGCGWEETKIFTYCIKFVVKVQKSIAKNYHKQWSEDQFETLLN